MSRLLTTDCEGFQFYEEMDATTLQEPHICVNSVGSSDAAYGALEAKSRKQLLVRVVE